MVLLFCLLVNSHKKDTGISIIIFIFSQITMKCNIRVALRLNNVTIHNKMRLLLFQTYKTFTLSVKPQRHNFINMSSYKEMNYCLYQVTRSCNFILMKMQIHKPLLSQLTFNSLIDMKVMLFQSSCKNIYHFFQSNYFNTTLHLFQSNCKDLTPVLSQSLSLNDKKTASFQSTCKDMHALSQSI